MEWTAGLVVGTLATQRDIVTHNIYDIEGGIYPIYGFAIDHRAKIIKSMESPPLEAYLL